MKSSRLLILYLSILLTAGLLVGTGLISNWGQWYSRDDIYRRQVEGFLGGSWGIDGNPMGIALNTSWSNGQVQQVWGLGVPLWRLPFELLAKCFGRDAFPDRLAFGVALFIIIWAVFLVFLLPRLCDTPSEWFAHLRRSPGDLAAVVILVLFPPFLTLSQSGFEVYEEAVAYGYLAGIGVFLVTVHFLRQPTLNRYAMLSLFSGLLALFRPTLLCYGLASFLIASWQTKKLKWPIQQSLLGLCLFCVGGGVLALTNSKRFGSALEFGHKLNLNGSAPNRFASRFDHPFRTEPLSSASVELYSCLFRAGNTSTHADTHGAHLFPGQSQTFRWRHLYFKSYDLSYFVMLLGVWLLALYRSVPFGRRAAGQDCLPAYTFMAGWSFASAAALALFYVRCPFIASRYLMDFAPSFAVAILAFVQALRTLLRGSCKTRSLSCGALFLLILWWGVEVFDGRKPGPRVRPLTFGELQDSREPERHTLPVLPAAYDVGMKLSPENIPFNGSGWDSLTGKTEASAAFFVNSPQSLELEVARAGSEPDYRIIQAKVGLELLKLQSIREVSNSVFLVFQGPRQQMYQSGLQVLFLGFVTPKELGNHESQFRLLRVNWRDTNRISEAGPKF